MASLDAIGCASGADGETDLHRTGSASFTVAKGATSCRTWGRFRYNA